MRLIVQKARNVQMWMGTDIGIVITQVATRILNARKSWVIPVRSMKDRDASPGLAFARMIAGPLVPRDNNAAPKLQPNPLALKTPVFALPYLVHLATKGQANRSVLGLMHNVITVIPIAVVKSFPIYLWGLPVCHIDC